MKNRSPDAPAAVHSVDHFVYTVPDIDVAARFYQAFGLDIVRAGRQIQLRTFGHPHPWATVVEAGLKKRLQYVRYGIHATDLDAFRERIGAHGVACEAHPLAQAHTDKGAGSLWLHDPDGTPIELVVADKVSPSSPTLPSSDPTPAAGVGAAPSRSRVQPVRPRYLSHILQFTPDVRRMQAFCEQVLGLRLSDRSADVIAFLHTPHGSDHHLVAFAKSHAPGLHHSSWDVGSVDEVGKGMEQMRNAGWGAGWGVGRHVLGSNFFNYVKDPWGSYCEYSAGIDYVPAGLAWPAADHPPEDSLYVWGPALPADFITNHEHPAALACAAH